MNIIIINIIIIIIMIIMLLVVSVLVDSQYLVYDETLLLVKFSSKPISYNNPQLFLVKFLQLVPTT